MNAPKTIPSATLVAAALVSAPASAQEPELDPEAVAAATRYGLPIAFNGFRSACRDMLPADGFFAENEARLMVKFAEGARGSWPEAKAALLQIASSETDGAAALIEGMPDEALKPFVDSLLEAMLAQEIKPENCGDIERGLELLDPMPVANIAGFLGFVIELDNRAERKKREAALQQQSEDQAE
ncbi:MAG: hypothetical protein AAGE86_02060 [Pseudomonadota bacterium]